MKAGTRHRATRLAEKRMASNAEAVVNAVVAVAKDGEMTAARLVLDRIALPAAAGAFGSICRRSSVPPI